MTANVTVVSPFRDSEKILEAYAERIQSLHYSWSKLRVICVEGDSVDDTYDILRMWATINSNFKLVKCDVHKPRHGSVINEERLQILATVFNAGLDAVDLDWSDYILFIPSDVIYGPDLINDLLAHDKDLIAPWFWTVNEHGVTRFYDTWAFCYRGEYFDQYSKSYFDERFQEKVLAMDTVGGVILMKQKIISEGCRYTSEAVDRGLCIMARQKGFGVWAALDVAVYHP